jgi:tetratricopeptide (TPR) repeat protein
MLDVHDEHKRLVIPKWLSLATATQRRDIEIPRSTPFALDSATRRKLEEDYAEFKHSPTPLAASDLMGSAFVVGEMGLAVEAATYVKKSSFLQKPTVRLADRILNLQAGEEPLAGIQVRIAHYKINLSEFLNNPLHWIELARLYTIKGQLEKAKRATTVALALAPSNRYVVRSAARFYIHIGDIEAAWHCAHRALALSQDPWIEATLVNVGMWLNKSPRQLTKGIPSEIPPNALYSYSELIETRGMLELESGNDRRARKHFRTAWSDPSENVVTHGEWILRNWLPGMSESAKLDLSASPEAEAWDQYWLLNLEKSMAAIREWALEEPYSRHPWILGSSVACQTNLYKEAEEQARQGLLANPRDFLLHNNLAFALLKSGRPDEAESVLKSSPEPNTETERPVSLATKGLLEFKKGRIERGREFYLKAVEECAKAKNPRLLAKAYLNLAIAEVETEGARAAEFVTAAIKAAKKHEDPDITLTARQLNRVIESKRESLAFPFGRQMSKLRQELIALVQVLEQDKK